MKTLLWISLLLSLTAHAEWPNRFAENMPGKPWFKVGQTVTVINPAYGFLYGMRGVVEKLSKRKCREWNFDPSGNAEVKTWCEEQIYLVHFSNPEMRRPVYQSAIVVYVERK